MDRQRSVFVLIVIPAVVALAVTLLVLFIFEDQSEPITTIVLTHSPTSQLAPVFTRPPAEASNGENTPDEEAGNGEASEESASEPVSNPPGPGCENPTHVVESGDLSGALVEEYDVTFEEFVEMNLIIDPGFDPNFLSIGQELIMPVCGIPTPTVAPTATNTTVPTRVVPTPIPTATEPPPGTVALVITGVLNLGDITSEAVEIFNPSSPVDLEGWTLSNERGEEFEFPTFRLFSRGLVTVHTGSGDDTPIDLFWGLNEAIWEIGDTVSLFDADGELHTEFVIEEEE